MAKCVDFKSIFIFALKLEVTTESKYLCNILCLQGKPEEGRRFATPNRTAISEKMYINASRGKWCPSNET